MTSAWFSSDSATNTISGTSMAAPHVAGVAATIISVSSGCDFSYDALDDDDGAVQARASVTPAMVEAVLKQAAAVNKVTDVQATPNLLLQTDRES